MHHISVKNWFHHMHMPERRDSVLKVNHLIHSEVFWAVVAITMILLTLMLIAWWGNVSTIAPLPDFRLTL